MDTDRVVFRKWRNGNIIALLPDNVVNLGMVSVYEHIGQHGEGNSSIIGITKPASPNEYHELANELRSIGYDLRIMKRLCNQYTKRG